jgi:hypothetical protein
MKVRVTLRLLSHPAFLESRELVSEVSEKRRLSRAGDNPESVNLLKRLDSRFHGNDRKGYSQIIYETISFDDLAKSLFERHPGESRGPEHLEITGFRLSPE